VKYFTIYHHFLAISFAGLGTILAPQKNIGAHTLDGA